MNKRHKDQLVAAYGKDAAIRTICDNFAGRVRNSWRPPVDLLARQTGLPRGEVVRVFKFLAGLELGTFRHGRRGHQSRFEWAYSPLSVGQTAAGERDEVEEITDEEKSQDTEAAEMIAHPYHLRADLTVTVELPADFSSSEASRFAAFVQTLPLEPK